VGLHSVHGNGSHRCKPISARRWGLAVKPAYGERLDAIAWGNFSTAYGPAVKVPDQLRRLAGVDRKAALNATHELWCGLCHQHVQVGSAALPALPFLLEVLDTADRDMIVELLDILLGFAIGSNRQRAVDFQQALGRIEIAPEEQWVADLRAALLKEQPRFRRLGASHDEDVADFAARIMAELGEQPDAESGAAPDPAM
jgi:hypothetical protein